MQRQFDFGATWSEASALITSNIQILVAVIGVFVVIPQFVLSMVMGLPPSDPSADPEAALAAVLAYYSDNLIFILIGAVIGIIGTLTVLTIYLDKSRPTVAAAISAAFTMVLSYFLTSVLTALAVGLGMIFLIVPGIYLAIKFICAGPIIVAEKERNPIAAMQRSWALTKGNSLRIFGFVLVLIVVLIVISTIVGIITGIFAFAGEGGVMFTIGQLLQVAFQGVITAVSLAVSAAIYRQLSGPDGSALQETFG